MPKAIRGLLWWIFAGTRGGITRARIIFALKDRPYNANQLADYLQLDYKTIRYHLEILTENKLLTTSGGSYGLMYHPSEEMESNFQVLEEIWEKTRKERAK